MANFSYEDYIAAKAAAEAKKSGAKVGFFKLTAGGEALVRFDVTGVADLYGATLHKVKRDATSKFLDMSVSCINEYGKKEDNCPLCRAADSGDERVGKAAKYGFVRMLVSYKDPTTGTYGAVQPVVWERKWNWLQTEITSKLTNYGDLTKQLFKITRTGSGLDTRYSVDYAVPAIFKPEMVPEDFSAFANFDITKHSYWVKTVEDCETYLSTGSFPEVVRDNIATGEVKAEAPKTAANVAQAAGVSTATSTPAPAVTTPATSVVEPVKEEKPATSFGTNFGGFSF